MAHLHPLDRGVLLSGDAYAICSGNLKAGFVYRAGTETPINFREEFRVSPRMVLKHFSAVDTQSAVPVSTAEVWISARDTQTSIFLGFWYTQLNLVFLPGDKIFGYFPEVTVTKIRVSARAPHKKPHR